MSDHPDCAEVQAIVDRIKAQAEVPVHVFDNPWNALVALQDALDYRGKRA